MAGLYLEFYGLRELPFSPTPDPRFLMMTPGHREALAQLTLAVQEGRGFAMLSGEIGTGKTTLVNALREQLDWRTAVAVVFSSLLPFEGLVDYALREWGVPSRGETHAERLFILQLFLLERHRAGMHTVLILDEAQNFSTETLEQVRLLSNFETSTDKLLQILLVGQPELHAKLARPELRQLSQRVAMRSVLAPLSAGETRHYIWNRLRIAGARSHFLFDDAAIARIAEYSGGVPRVINSVCDQCLIVGYADQRHRLGVDVVDDVIREFARTRGDNGQPGRALASAATPRPPGLARRWLGAVAARVFRGRWATAGVVAALALGLLLGLSASAGGGPGGYLAAAVGWGCSQDADTASFLRSGDAR
jgi:general secretion pathway protein A